MQKAISLSLLILLCCATGAHASKIKRITLAELEANADLIVMAKVTTVAKDGNRDHVTIKADSYLKGKGTQKSYTFTLVTRGELKDFDPALKAGDTGVFFLKRKEIIKKGNYLEIPVEKAYWGSVATFQKNHFQLTAKTNELHAKTAEVARRKSWPASREPFQVRLALQHQTASPNSRNLSLVLEVRNNSENRAEVAFNPVDLDLELSDSAGKPVERVRPPISAPVPAPRVAVVPPGDYVGFAVRYRPETAPPKGRVLLDAGWDYYWLLKPGEYRLQGTVDLTVRHGIAGDDTVKKQITVQVPEVAVEIPE